MTVISGDSSLGSIGLGDYRTVVWGYKVSQAIAAETDLVKHGICWLAINSNLHGPRNV